MPLALEVGEPDLEGQSVRGRGCCVEKVECEMAVV